MGLIRAWIPQWLRVLSRSPFMKPVRWLWQSMNSSLNTEQAYSAKYEVISGVAPPLLYGFQNSRAAEIQHAAFKSVLHEMYAGKARDDFTAVAAAVRITSVADPVIIEVGCASGWNVEVLSYLLNRPVRYIGLDYSSASIKLGMECYPHVRFIIGDATELPIRDGACDILLSGTVLMHLWAYERAIQESRRVSRKWCIFHTVTVMQGRPTTFLRKLAYGSPVIEVVFNQQHLLSLFEDNGLILRHALDSLPYDLSEHLGERSFSKTYVCEIARK